MSSGDVTVGYLKRLSHIPDNENNGQLIAGQNYYDVFFTGGVIDGVTLGLLSPVVIGPNSFDATSFSDGVLYVSGSSVAADINFTYSSSFLQIQSGPSTSNNSLFRLDVTGGIDMSLFDNTGTGIDIRSTVTGGGTSSISLGTYSGVSTSLHTSIIIGTTGGTNIAPANVATGTVVGTLDFTHNYPGGSYAHMKVTASGTQSSTASPARVDWYTTPAGAKENNTNPAFSLLPGGDSVHGFAVLATTATTGFPWIPSSAGPPTGAPTAPYTGATALVYDTVNHKLWARDGATWKGVVLA